MHCGDEQEFLTHFLPICLANDIPKIIPYGCAVDNRVRVISYNKRFVDDPQSEDELQKDDNIVNELKTYDFQRAFIGLLIKEYQKYQEHGLPEEPNEVIKAKEDWIETENGCIESFLENYEITNNEKDYVISNEIKEYLKEANLGISMKKFGMEIKKYCKKKLTYLSEKFQYENEKYKSEIDELYKITKHIETVYRFPHMSQRDCDNFIKYKNPNKKIHIYKNDEKEINEYNEKISDFIGRFEQIQYDDCKNKYTGDENIKSIISFINKISKKPRYKCDKCKNSIYGDIDHSLLYTYCNDKKHPEKYQCNLDRCDMKTKCYLCPRRVVFKRCLIKCGNENCTIYDQTHYICDECFEENPNLRIRQMCPACNSRLINDIYGHNVGFKTLSS